MRIYIAALSNVVGHTAPHMRVLGKANPRWVLESYHYMNAAKEAEIRRQKRKVFLDSGAYTMFTEKIELNLKDYARYIHANPDIIEVAASQDIIGEGREQENYDRFKALEALGCKVLPVHHVRDADVWLQRYIDEGYEYICLGGMVPESTPYLRAWLDHVWHKYLTKPDGTPKVKVHGFGMTVLSLMFRYPWFSVDSTAWIMISRFGGVMIDIPGHKDFKVDFSNRSRKQQDIHSWHYTCLPEPRRKLYEARVAELEANRPKDPVFEKELNGLGFKTGYTPEAFAESYGWRGHFTIHYFDRIQERRVDRFIRQQDTLFDE